MLGLSYSVFYLNSTSFLVFKKRPSGSLFYKGFTEVLRKDLREEVILNNGHEIGVFLELSIVWKISILKEEI